MLKCEMPPSRLTGMAAVWRLLFLRSQLRLELKRGTVLVKKSFDDESQSGAKVPSGNGAQCLIRNMNKEFITQGGTPITADLATVIRRT